MIMSRELKPHEVAAMAYKGWVLYRMTVEVSVVLYHFWLIGIRFNEFRYSVQ